MGADTPNVSLAFRRMIRMPAAGAKSWLLPPHGARTRMDVMLVRSTMTQGQWPGLIGFGLWGVWNARAWTGSDTERGRCFGCFPFFKSVRQHAKRPRRRGGLFCLLEPPSS